MKRSLKSHKRSTKLLAMVLSVLMILGAMPLFTFAADGDTATDEIVTKWPVAEREIELNEFYADAGLTGGEASIPGEFVYVSTTARSMNFVGVKTRDIQFVPTDTTIAPIPGTVDVTVVQSKSLTCEGSLTTTAMQIGQKLKVSTISKGSAKLISHGYVVPFPFMFEWKNPDKVMNEVGTFKETVICTPRVPIHQPMYAPIEIETEVVVNEIDPDKVWLEELPTYTEPLGGLTVAESCKLSGGLVTKGGKEIPGTWAWSSPDIVLTVGRSLSETLIFTPDDPSVCEPIKSKTIMLSAKKDAPTGKVEVDKPPVASSIELGQTLADSTLTDGEANLDGTLVPGVFSWKDPTIAPKVGTANQTAVFTPTDPTACDPIEVQVPVTVYGPVVKKYPSSTNIEVGQKASDSVLSGGVVVKGDREIPGTWAWKEPDRVADSPNGLHTYAIFTPTDSNDCAPFEVQLTIDVDEYTVVEFPTIEKLIPGTKYGDYKFTGGLVTKGGQPINGTWAWNSPSRIVEVGDYEQTITFDPWRYEDGMEGYYGYPVNVEKIPLEIQWPDIKGTYVVDGEVGGCISSYKGTANLPGYFDVDSAIYSQPIPDKVGGTADITVTFDPTAKAYETQTKVITVTFEAPAPSVSVKVSANSSNRNNTDVNCSINYKPNWPKHTGKAYLVVDGKRYTELTNMADNGEYYSVNEVVTLTDLAYGEHEFSCEYVAGENDVLKSSTSDVVKFKVNKYFDVTVNDFAGTKTNTYAVGTNVTITAANHEKPYYDFDKWAVEGTELPEGTDLSAQQLNFVMPDGNVNLTASYKFNFGSFIKFGFQKVVGWFIDVLPQIIEFVKGLFPQQ